MDPPLPERCLVLDLTALPEPYQFAVAASLWPLTRDDSREGAVLVTGAILVSEGARQPGDPVLQEEAMHLPPSPVFEGG